MNWARLNAVVHEQLEPVRSAVGKAWGRLAEWRPIRELLLQYSQTQRPSFTTGPLLSIKNNMASVTTVDLLQLATSLPYATQITSFATGIENVTFQSFDSSFASILGTNASWRMIANETWQAFHEAGVYNQETNSLYIASNWAFDFSNPINVTVLNMENYTISSQRYEGLASPNGGTTYVPPGQNSAPQILFCDEGDFNVASGLTIVDPVGKKTQVTFTITYSRHIF